MNTQDPNPYYLQPGAIPINDFHTVNPFKNETWNLKQQMLIQDEFPEAAARLKQEAENVHK